MSYLVLARKYRPQTFEDLVGQEPVARTLKNAVASGRLAHAYLFFGPRGVGKTTTARLLSKALNCSRGPADTPCNQCPPCLEIAQGNCLDVLEIDAASHTGVDHVREAILDTVALAPSRDRYKIFIVDEAHMLSPSAFNAFLKTLEEPPSHVVFILATTEPARIPPTIFSRCQRFRFRPASLAVLNEHLGRISSMEKIRVEPQALDLIARAASGSLRDAVSLLDQASSFSGGAVTQAVVQELLGFLPEDLLLGVTRAVLDKNPRQMWQYLEKVYEQGYEPLQMVRDLRDWWERLYLDRLGLSADLAPLWSETAQEASAQAFSYLLRRLNRLLEDLRLSDSPRTSLEIGLLGLLESPYDLGEWVRRLEDLEHRLREGGPCSADPGGGGEEAPSILPKADAPCPGLQMPIGALWEKVLGSICRERPALFSYLEKSRLEWNGKDPQWRLVLPSSFHRDGTQRSLGLVEGKISQMHGKPVRLVLEVEPSLAGPPASVEDEGWPQEEPVTQTEPDPDLRKVLEVFPGKIHKQGEK